MILTNMRGASRRLARTWTLSAALALVLAGCESGQISDPVTRGIVWTRITTSSVTPDPLCPDWRGDLILFSFTNVNKPNLATVRSDGTEITKLSAGSNEVISYSARWLTDSTLIYASNLGGNFNLWRRGLADGTQQAITSFTENEFDPAPRPGTNGVAYAESSEFRGRIVLIPDMDAATPERYYLTASNLQSGQPDWDPTGTRVCFSALGSGGTTRHIWLVTLAPGDSTPVQLTTGPFVDSSPRFSPDGTRIVFATNRSGRPSFWSISMSSGNLDAVAFDDAGTTSDTPCLSPDQSKLVVSSNGRGFGTALWVLSNLP